jgi:hypothetical protein
MVETISYEKQILYYYYLFGQFAVPWSLKLDISF